MAEWLFQRVAAVVHHCGAGTTGCGLRNGRPTTIAPFFGEFVISFHYFFWVFLTKFNQQFWGDMVAATCTGPRPIPFKTLNSKNLADAIRICLSKETAAAAQEISAKMQMESAVKTAVGSFHRCLPHERMSCNLLPHLPAVWPYKN